MAIQRVLDYLKKLLLGVGILLLFYIFIGFLVVPPFLKFKLPDILQQETGRKTLISAVKFQPFYLILNIQGIQILEPDGQPLIALDELTVDLNWLASIKQVGLVVDEVIINKPMVNVVINKSGALNLKDLFKANSKKPPAADSEDLDYFVTQLSIQDGSVSWTDMQADIAIKEEINAVNIHLKNLNNSLEIKSELDAALLLKSGGELQLRGNFNIAAESAEGHVSLNKVSLNTLVAFTSKAQLPVIVRGYEGLEADFSVNGFSKDPKLRIKNAFVNLNDVELLAKEQNKKLISIPALKIAGIELNLKQKTLGIKSISAANGLVYASLEADGVLNYATLFAKPEAQDKEETQPVVETKAVKDKPWDIKVAGVEVTNFGLDFEDKTLKSPVKVNLHPINFKVTEYTNTPDIKTPIELMVGINNAGSIKLQGNAVAEPLAAEVDLKIENIDLEKFQSYYEKFVHLDVIDGALNMEGKLTFAKLDQDRPDIQFIGNVEISRLLTRDQILNKDFVKWDAMFLKDMDINYLSNTYAAKSVLFDKPYLRISIRKDKTVNFNDILVVDEQQSKTNTKVVQAEGLTDSGRQASFHLGTVQIKEGASDFSDLSLILPFEARIQSLAGGASGISSEKDSKIKVALKGSAYDLAPVDIDGEMSPYIGSYHAKVNFKGLPMPLVTPYMVQFSGYKVEKGKMTLGLNYNVANSDLSATNSLLIDQFELGERVENPNAVALPIKLAVALLKDAQGQIKIDLPISGSLNDPQFSIGGVVADALYKGLGHLVASPFTTLALLIGDEKDLNLISFEPGSSSLTQGQKDKLLELAQALRTRPNLDLEIKGAAFQSQDWPFIRQDALYEQLKRQRAAELNKDAKKRIRDEYVQLSNDDYKRLLADFFIEKFPKLAKRTLLGEPVLLDSSMGEFYQVAKENLITLIKPEPERLKSLATSRAQTIANFLVHHGAIPAENIYLLDTLVDLDSTDKEIVTMLFLNAK